MGGIVYSPTPPPETSTSRAGRDGSRNSRYTYLVGRLHNRQLTMEEATELFTVMQGMLQTSEAARIALMRTPTAPTPSAHPPPPPPERAAPSSAGDDMLLLGIFAMGAGAGLLAAMTKRIQDATPGAGSTSPARTSSGSASRSG